MFYICVCSNSLNWEKVKGKVHIDILGMCRLNEESMHSLVSSFGLEEVVQFENKS